MTYDKFNTLPLVAKMNLIQDILSDAGYVVGRRGKRDRQTAKAITQFQKENGLTPNGVICRKTYQALITL